MKSADRFQLLVPFVDDANDAIHEWVDFDCSAPGCSLDPADNPELLIPSPTGSSFTPLGGSLRGAQRFFQGNDTNITDNAVDDLDSIYTTASIEDPIFADPLNADFVSPGQQCRPYVVVLLTDGAETCEVFDDTGTDDTVGSAAALLSTLHPDTGLTYRIETKPIGFGLTAGDAQIEALAHAGGEPDVAGNQGFYANSELELINAFNQIISDSILVEVCDGEDNDCDGAIDEGFQLFCDRDNVLGGGVVPNNDPGTGICVNPGDDCDNTDDNCAAGVTDEPLNACGICGLPPAEVCNLSDDDCDGLVDESGGVEGAICGACVPTGAEQCNGDDDDCDGTIDEDVTQACGVDIGVCTSGTETCIVGGTGQFADCTGTDCTEVGDGTCNEICDNLDNDCDGTIDGFAQECFDAGNPPPHNAPCQPGFQVCTAGEFGDCQGEVGPSTESCDLVDNDCDTDIDEDTGGANCDSACGVGTSVCNAGVLECDSMQTPLDDELCNNFDDDCDGVIDENVPDPVPNTCDEGGTLCVPGVLQCIGGGFVCTGGEAPGIEVCDCNDNDCDDNVDEGSTCPTGSTCVDCQCAIPCQPGEFPCPTGQICNDTNFCVTDPCFNVTCPPENGSLMVCDPDDGQCVPACDQVFCPTGTRCRPSDGTCQFDDCRGFPELCSEDEFCVVDECVSDPCAGVDCPAADEYCFEGACVGSCGSVTCPDGQECVLGECQPAPCNGSCEDGQVCNSTTDTCQNDPCNSPCGEGQVCNPDDGQCIADPCNGVECPGDEVCDFGTCYPASHNDDAGPDIDHDYVAPGGGGGCSTGGGAGALAGLLLLLALALRTKRDEEVN
jgi:hypothetical protein